MKDLFTAFENFSANQDDKTTDNVELELQAIDSVRNELALAVQNNDFNAERDAHSRLMSLYASMNVQNVLVAIHRVNFKRAA